MDNKIEVVFFDFGGVLAEEGFFQGLGVIAQKHGLDDQAFFQTVVEEIYSGGYVTGRATEAEFWEALRRSTGITGKDQELRGELLERFVVRPEMLALVEECRNRGKRTAILSDQTNWLDELDGKYGFSQHFEKVFNSFHEGMSKREHKFFHHVLDAMNVAAHRAAFIDDSRAHVGRAKEVGLKAVLCEDLDDMARDLVRICPSLTGFLARHWPKGLAKAGQMD
ncbi:MAG: HAD family phosphatase [Desulfovibrio sp.]|nr:MAG: HAD family phosphatase [Desulfovibrio sp.]